MQKNKTKYSHSSAKLRKNCIRSKRKIKNEKKLSLTLQMNLRMDWTDHKNYVVCPCAKLEFVIMYMKTTKIGSVNTSDSLFSNNTDNLQHALLYTLPILINCAFFCKITELFMQPLAPFYFIQGRDSVNNWVTTSFSRRILFHENSQILRRKDALLLFLHVIKQRLKCGHILKCVNNNRIQTKGFWIIFLDCLTLKKKALQSSETLGTSPATQHHVRENLHLQQHCHNHLKSHNSDLMDILGIYHGHKLWGFVYEVFIITFQDHS